MSLTLSTKKGSVESLKVFERWGWTPNNCRMRPTALLDIPVAAAALPWVRVDKAYRFETSDGSASHLSTYARGLDGLWGMDQWLDRAPKGRNEPSAWWRRHDEYEKR